MSASKREQARIEIVAAAQSLLDGHIGALEAARRIANRRHDLDPEQQDEDLLGFAGIDSQTDHLLIGADMNVWHPRIRQEKKREIEDTEEFFRASALECAAAIIARYGPSA